MDRTIINKIDKKECVDIYGYMPTDKEVKILNDIDEMRAFVIAKWESK